MNTIQFTGTERDVGYEGYLNPEIPKEHFGFNKREIKSTPKEGNEVYVNEGLSKKLLLPFGIIKIISRDDVEKWDTDFLIEFIVKMHHEFTRNNTVIIYRLAQKVAYRHCENHPELLTLTEVIFLFFHDLLNELKQEEFCFAHIRQIANEKRHRQIPVNSDSKILTDTIKLVQKDLEKALNYLKVIRQITSDYKIPLDACHFYKSLFEKLKEFEEYLIVHGNDV
jgi:iron-sulfur cluster repair protein YtfE (RIC family)